ncbi:MAG TPA: two-component regulator propeller domain-containing protein, partial [Rudaea sp.]|nr:two-component regulator propeller domain-containing protein [Rudaea sp.]
MGKRLATWWWLLLLLPAFAVHAGERRYYFDDADSERGLASHSVNAIFQDRTGFIWIATDSGLHRYDGYGYQRFDHSVAGSASLPDSVITAIAQDGDGRLWVGTRSHGLTAIDAASGKILSNSQVDTAKPSQRDVVSALLFDDRGLWIGTHAGIELMDTSTGRRRELYHFLGGMATQVGAFARAADGTIWSATSAGVIRFAPNSDTPQTVDAQTLPSALSIAAVNDGVYVGGTSGLYHVGADNRVTEVWPVSDAHGLVQVRSIVQDQRGRLWLAVFGAGLTVFDPADEGAQSLHHEIGMPGSLPDDYVTHLMIDRSGLLWVGGDLAGVATTDPDGAQFRYVMDPSSARNQMTNNVRSILDDGGGRLWLGTDGDGLKRYDPARGTFEYFDDVFKVVPTNDGDPQWHVTSLASAGDGKIWAATNHGAFLFDAVARRATPLPVDPKGSNGLPSSYARTVLVAADGSVWFGMFDSGLAHWISPNKPQAHWETFHPDATKADSLGNDLVVSLTEDDAGRIWIGTINGLSVYDVKQRKMRTFRNDPSNPQSLGDNLIRAVYQSGDGALWIGTQSGLDRLDVPGADNPHFVHYTTAQGLPGATVFGILEDAHHNIWISTNNGIATYSRALGAFMSFAVRDGLQGLEFNAGAAYRRGDGELVFGGLHGLNLFRPDVIRHDTYVPPIFITGAAVGDAADATPIPAGGLSIEQSQRIVRFDFASLDFIASDRNRFSYRLRGFDPDWINAGTRHTATYTNLPAGDYEFDVRGSNGNAIWNEAGTSLQLRVVPPWWASTIMKAGYAAIMLGLLGCLWIAYRERRERELQYHRELREREDRLRLALWGSGDEFWDWDIPGRMIHRLGTDREGGGRTERAVSTDDWRHKVVHPEDLPFVERSINEHILGDSEFFEIEHRTREGDDNWIWVLSRGKVVERDENGKALRVCGTARDVTAARLAERERRIASEVIDSMSEAVSVTDLDFNFVAVNRAFTRMFGYQETEVLMRPATILNSTQHSQEHYEAMRQSFLASGHWHGELWQKRKNGEEFLSWIEVSEVRDAAGRRTHYVGVTNDITER